MEEIKYRLIVLYWMFFDDEKYFDFRYNLDVIGMKFKYAVEKTFK